MRNLQIDLLKIIAIIGVLITHICGGGGGLAVGTGEWTFTQILTAFSRACVPVFIMCTGAVMLDPGKVLSIRKVWTQYIPRLFVAMIVWGLAYKAFHFALDPQEQSFSFYVILQWIKEAARFEYEFHFYFFRLIFIVYIFVPILRIFTAAADKRQIQYALTVIFILGILWSTLAPYYPINRITGLSITQAMINSTYASIGYALLGHYLKTYPVRSLAVNLPAFLAGGAVIFLTTLIGSSAAAAAPGAGGLYVSPFSSGYNVFSFALAFGGFGISYWLCRKIDGARKDGTHDVHAGLDSHGTIKRNAPLRGVITYLSKASFCIYLTHIFFLLILAKAGLSVTAFPAYFSVPAILAVTFGLSTLVYFVIRHIPILRDWII